MPFTLDRLPFDVLFYVTSHLEFDDIVSLALTCRQLKTLLQENGVCRKAIEGQFPHTKEAQLAREQHISYCEAFSYIQDRRNAFSGAHPFAARIVGQGNDFCYRQGMLCILKEKTIRVLDAHGSTGEITVDLLTLVNVSSESSTFSPDSKTSLLYYNEGIVTVYYKRDGRSSNGCILAVSTKRDPPDTGRLVKSVPVESCYKLFARHTSQYLYYGTYSAVGSQGHYEWEIQGISLNNGTCPSSYSSPLQLPDFFGTDIGSTIAFEIHKDHFYAVSNETHAEVEEIDWTSFYHCIRFPLACPEPGTLESNRKVWRRQHVEGVIHDSWTDLSLQVDESTDAIMIIEARREWQKSCSRQVRTFYISEFLSNPDTCKLPTEGSPRLVASTGPMLPYDDAYVATLDSSNDPHYAPPQPRYNWNFHPETPGQTNPARSFILARTKLRTYNYSCASFLDLVEDDRCCPSPSPSPSPPCLRLRIGSRRPASPHWASLQKTMPKPHLLVPPAFPSDVPYRHSPTTMWPPPASQCACASRLHSILNPDLPEGPASTRFFTGVLDERSLVYMIRPGRSFGPGDDNALGVIVLVGFQRGAVPAGGVVAGGSEEAGEGFDPEVWRWVPGACRRRVCR